VTSTITWAVTAETMTLGSRLEVLALMVRGAYRLAGMTDDRKTSAAPPLPVLQGAVKEPKRIVDLTPLAVDSSVDSGSLSGPAPGSKTIIKRPLRLASLKQRTKYFRNHFPLCAENFFSVVLRSLNESLREIFNAKEVSGETDPGIQILFPAQALLALGAFTRCAINTPLQKKFVSLLLPFSFQLLREVPSLHIRRASAVALFDAMESLFLSMGTSQQQRVTQIDQQTDFGTLNYALNIFRDPSSGPSALSQDLAPLVVEIVNWISQNALREDGNGESDQHCRVFQLEILRKAIFFLESSH
jgi:hypothetical protein